MALFNRIKVTTATTGTSDLTLSATGVRDATNGDCFAPAEILSAIGPGNRFVTYWLQNGGNMAWGNGSLSTDGLTLRRDTYEKSWNGSALSTAKLTLTGTTTMFISARASDLGAGRRGRTVALARGAVFA